jgi:hypothetical protein
VSLTRSTHGHCAAVQQLQALFFCGIYAALVMLFFENSFLVTTTHHLCFDFALSRFHRVYFPSPFFVESSHEFEAANCVDDEECCHICPCEMFQSDFETPV